MVTYTERGLYTHSLRGALGGACMWSHYLAEGPSTSKYLASNEETSLVPMIKARQFYSHWVWKDLFEIDTTQPNHLLHAST